MSRELIERPVELTPQKIASLMNGPRQATLVLPMLPAPEMTEEVRRRLYGELLLLGYAGAWDDDVALLDTAWNEGLLPDLRCPYGRGGDVLYLREPWSREGGRWRYAYRDAVKGDGLVWIPAARMPREASRLVMKLRRVEIGAGDGGRPAWHVAVSIEGRQGA
ncbi:MAG: hypothetical protein JSS57_04400 [Proteobacteria bacterium]|nr:hypothetical protein [Pseudomonadota bacterium]